MGNSWWTCGSSMGVAREWLCSPGHGIRNKVLEELKLMGSYCFPSLCTKIKLPVIVRMCLFINDVGKL
jgi:hypothetical protein